MFKKEKILQIDQTEMPYEDYQSPEQKLLIAILDRAYRDLESADKLIRRSAYNWFNSDSEDYLTFKYTCEICGFDEKRILIKVSENKLLMKEFSS